MLVRWQREASVIELVEARVAVWNNCGWRWWQGQKEVEQEQALSRAAWASRGAPIRWDRA